MAKKPLPEWARNLPELTNEQKRFKKHLKWFEEHLTVVDKAGRGVVPLKFNEIQATLEFLKWDAMRQKKPVHLLVLKCRQPGVSTWGRASSFKTGMDMDHRRSIAIAHDQDATDNLLEMTHFFHDSYTFPCEICHGNELKKCDCEDGRRRLETIKQSSGALKLKHNKSEFMTKTAGAKGKATRSFNAMELHFSEYDYWDDAQKTYAAAMQVIPDVYPVVVIVESTAQYPDGPLEKMWRAAVRGENEFTPVFFAWWQFKLYDRKLSWEDMGRYSPKSWREHHKGLLESLGLVTRREDYLALGRRGHVQSGSDQESSNGGSGGDPEGLGTEGAGAGDAPGQDAGDDRREVEGAGDSPGGRVPSVSGRRRGSDGDHRSRRHDESTELRRGLRKAGGPERKGRTRAQSRADEQRGGELERNFQDSLTPYERGLIEEFELSLTQINWLRYCLYHKCNGDEVDRRREYPSRPEEAFEATGSDILDPYVIAKWTKEAQALVDRGLPPKHNQTGLIRVEMQMKEDAAGRFHARFIQSNDGFVEIYEWPDPKKKYVCAVDPSEGLRDSDWQVATIIDLDTGDQCAEFRARIDPDLAVDQVEGMAFFFNRAYTAVEINKSRDFARHLSLRGTLPMYERESFDRIGGVRVPTKRLGWSTDTSTRPMVYTELRQTIRQDRCQIRSLETLKECRTLWHNKRGEHLGKIEARPGCHDDGPEAHGIALFVRNKMVRVETDAEKEERRQPQRVKRLRARRKKATPTDAVNQIAVRTPVKTINIRAGVRRWDGRRSAM